MSINKIKRRQDDTHVVFGVKRGHEYLAVLNAGDAQVPPPAAAATPSHAAGRRCCGPSGRVSVARPRLSGGLERDSGLET